MLKEIKSNIPNFITSLNLLSGATACIFAFYYAEMIGGLHGYEWVWIFIGASALFDFCDGAMARVLDVYSELGKELDSLSDLISFGLAPTLLMFNMIVFYNDGVWSWWAFVSLLIVVGGALRLAKFNIDKSQHTSFRGLPIPANAIFWIGFSSWVEMYVYPGVWIVAIAIVFMALMMVCRLRMFSLKFTNFSLTDNLKRYMLLGGAIVLLLTTGLSGFCWTVVLYIIMSLFGVAQTHRN